MAARVPETAEARSALRRESLGTLLIACIAVNDGSDDEESDEEGEGEGEREEEEDLTRCAWRA